MRTPPHLWDTSSQIASLHQALDTDLVRASLTTVALNPSAVPMTNWMMADCGAGRVALNSSSCPQYEVPHNALPSPTSSFHGKVQSQPRGTPSYSRPTPEYQSPRQCFSWT